MQRNLGIGVALAAVILAAFLYFLRDPSIDDGPGAAGTTTDGAVSSTSGGAGDETPGEAEATDPEVTTEEETVPDDPEAPPMLVGRVTGEGQGIPGAKVFLFHVAGIEALIERIQDQVAEFAGEMPEIPRVISLVKAELLRFKNSPVVTTTDDEGNFELRNARPGGYLVLTVAEEWLFRYGDVVSLTRDRTSELPIALERGATIGGRVVSPSGEGLAGVRVIAEFKPSGMAGVGKIVRRLLAYVNGEFLKGPFETRTAADGSFEIRSLPPGSYDMVAYDSRGLEGMTSGVATGTSNVVILFGDGATLEGVLTDADGFPVPDVQVKLESERSLIQLPAPAAMFGGVVSLIGQYTGDGPKTTETGEDGRFEFSPLGAGRYRVMVEQSGFLTFAKPVELNWGESLSLGSIPVSRGRSVTGVVRTEEGHPIEDAVVLGFPQNPGFMNMGATMRDFMNGRTRTRTAPDGTFVLSGLGRGPLRVSVTARGYSPSNQDGVKAGDEPLEFFLTPGRALEGRVVSVEDGSPMAGVRVKAGEMRTQTDAEGRFALEGVLDPDSSMDFFAGGGGFAVQARALPADGERPEKMLEVEATLKGYLNAEAEVSYDNPPREVVLEMERAPVIRGFVRDPDGEPAAGALVRLGPSIPEVVGDFIGFDTGLIFFAVTVADLDGRFSMENYSVAGGNDRYQILADQFGFGRGRSEGFRLSEIGEDVEIEVDLIRGSVLKGQVTDGSQPLPGAIVRLSRQIEDEDGRGERRMMQMMGFPKGGKTVYTDADGNFSYDHVTPGSFELTAEMAGFKESQKERFVVGEGEERNFTFTLDPGEVLTGLVVDDQGVLIPGATVRVLRGDEENEDILEAQRLMGGAFKRTRTDDEGRFTIEGLPDIRYSVLAEKAGYSRTESDDVWPGAGHQPRLVLVPAAQLMGAVVDMASGDPVTSYRLSLTRVGADLNPWQRGGYEVNDAEGLFRRDDLEAGVYDVSVKAAGFVTAESQIELSPALLTEQTFALERAGRIVGQVFAEGTRNPIVRARVGLARPKRESESDDGEETDEEAIEAFFTSEMLSERVNTDSEGRFVIDTVPAGPQTLVITHNDYVQYRKTGVEVTLGQQVEIEVVLDEGLYVAGVVRDQTGQLLRNRFTFLRGAGPGTDGVSKTARTDDDGRFRVSGLEKGTYRILAPGRGGGSPEAKEIELEESMDDLEITVDLGS